MRTANDGWSAAWDSARKEYEPQLFKLRAEIADLQRQVRERDAESTGYVAWCRYAQGPGDSKRILICDSDDPGAFKVYRDAYVQEKVAEAVLAEHKNHAQFASDMYSIMVDPCAEGTTKESEMFAILLETARDQREQAESMSFYRVLATAQIGLERWKEKPHNSKWWKRIDSTPIPNDLLVNVCEEIVKQYRSLAANRRAAQHPSEESK